MSSHLRPVTPPEWYRTRGGVWYCTHCPGRTDGPDGSAVEAGRRMDHESYCRWAAEHVSRTGQEGRDGE